MNITKTKLDGVWILETPVYEDQRGWFTETYSKDKLEKFGIKLDFVQDNHSMSAKRGTLRGLHFQKNPMAQTKLVRCTRGRIFDVAVDLRRGSPTYRQWTGVELSEENRRQLLIPKGFAHGFATLTDGSEIQYKVDAPYAPELDRSIRFDDPELGIQWDLGEPLLSDKDRNAPLLRDSDVDFTMKYLVTGARGQLGFDVAQKLREQGMEVVAADLQEFDLTDKSQTDAYIRKQDPDVIIHCAAYTAVDRAEDEKALAFSINVEGTRAIAEAARAIHATMVYVSTDYVFDGQGEEPHAEEKPTAPVNYYGYTKEQGEKAVRELLDKHFIVRSSWIYGINGNNFVRTMLTLAETKTEIQVVADQIGAPTYSKDLADFIVHLSQTNKYGIYHAVNEGYCSWYEFAKAIFEEAGVDVQVLPIDSSGFPSKAIRPKNSRLAKGNTDLAGLPRMPHWKDALTRYITELIPRKD